jgi:hypothetical protein
MRIRTIYTCAGTLKRFESEEKSAEIRHENADRRWNYSRRWCFPFECFVK